jgi:hypothetical protein
MGNKGAMKNAEGEEIRREKRESASSLLLLSSPLLERCNERNRRNEWQFGKFEAINEW